MEGTEAGLVATREADAEGRVTIAEIARQAGVSVPTVPPVVNGRSDVPPRTRARVEGLDSPWAVEIIRSVEEVSPGAVVGTVVSAIRGRSGSAREWMRNLRARASDGAVFVTPALEPVLHEDLRILGVPLVAVDPAGSSVLGVPTIGAAKWSGGTAVTQHCRPWDTAGSV